MRKRGGGTAVRGGRTPALLFGAVLAGGESRRMGRDKARLRVGGETLWRRQVRVLREAGAGQVVVVRREGQTGMRGVRVVRDVFAGVGPLAGLHAALAAAGDAGWVAVLAVDMPAVEAAWFARLRKQCARGRGAVARHADGFEPLAAIYPGGARVRVERRLRRGEHALQGLVRALVRAKRMSVVEIAEAETAMMLNWNSPADRRRKGKGVGGG